MINHRCKKIITSIRDLCKAFMNIEPKKSKIYKLYKKYV